MVPFNFAGLTKATAPRQGDDPQMGREFVRRPMVSKVDHDFIKHEVFFEKTTGNVPLNAT